MNNHSYPERRRYAQEYMLCKAREAKEVEQAHKRAYANSLLQEIEAYNKVRVDK